jgi:tyrosyl-DNA phosphodiesterase 2
VDLWSKLNPNDPGFTYDGKKNGMLGPYNRFRTRLDRVMVKMTDWKPTLIKMVGTEQIVKSSGPATYKKKSKKGVVKLPLLPSDHFGLYAKFVPT